MKNKIDKRIKILAQKIANLESQIQLGKDVQENQKKIENIVLSLSFEDMILIDDYIITNYILTR